jgi:hypothetical protein
MADQQYYPGAPQRSEPTPMDVLQQWYNPALGRNQGEGFNAQAARLGVDPTQAATQIAQNVYDSKGTSFRQGARSWLKDLAGLVGVAAGGTALAGGFGAAGGAGGAAATTPYIAPGASITGAPLEAGASAAAPSGAAGGSGAAHTAGGASHWSKLFRLGGNVMQGGGRPAPQRAQAPAWQSQLMQLQSAQDQQASNAQALAEALRRQQGGGAFSPV